MWCPDDFKSGLQAYRNGFAWGLLLGVIGWLIIGKPIYSLPLITGLLFGAIAFKMRITQIEKNRNND